MSECLRIGCGGAFWGDSPEGPRQLVNSGQIDVMVLDYLAEITMSLLAKARVKNPEAGYATDFTEVVAQLAPQIAAQKIKVVTNAGGVNPQACRRALAEKLSAHGISLKIGIVEGDDLLSLDDQFRSAGIREMFTGASFPQAKLWSSNAYLGALPIAAALKAGADIVITGRCVDSALALGPLIAHFGWAADDYDRLAAGSLAGHVIECGTQATGGIVTDWKNVVDDWDDMGFPIAECRSDGSFVLTKPAHSGGIITPGTIAEQIVYEVGDPAAYLLPDVTCDFRRVRVVPAGNDRVEISGARGRAPTSQYKVSTTYQDGFRASGSMMIGGVDAVDKAKAVAAAILKRTRRLLAERGFADYSSVDVEVLGSEANWGPHARAQQTREVVLKLAVKHAEKAALEVFSKEVIPAATSMAQGITGFAGGRPSVTPVVRLFSWLVDKSEVPIAVDVDGVRLDFSPVCPVAEARVVPEVLPADESASSTAPAAAASRSVPLIALAYGRSGDKGDTANIGVIARRDDDLPLLRAQLTAPAVAGYLSHLVKGRVDRFEWPGLHGFNFLLQDALGGGGMASLRHDPQGKLLAQILMDFPIQVPTTWPAPQSTRLQS